jgi:hypothetical protein
MVDEPVFLPNRGAQDNGLAASGNLFVVIKNNGLSGQVLRDRCWNDLHGETSQNNHSLKKAVKSPQSVVNHISFQ